MVIVEVYNDYGYCASIYKDGMFVDRIETDLDDETEAKERIAKICKQRGFSKFQFTN